MEGCWGLGVFVSIFRELVGRGSRFECRFACRLGGGRCKGLVLVLLWMIELVVIELVVIGFVVIGFVVIELGVEIHSSRIVVLGRTVAKHPHLYMLHHFALHYCAFVRCISNPKKF